MSETVRLHTLMQTTGCSLMELLVQGLRGPLAGRHTLLAVCPNSAAVTRAALLAAQEAHAPLLYAATLNQVDVEAAYTGWTPQSLATFVEAENARLLGAVPVALCLDHGGPWKKDLHVTAGFCYTETMTAVKRSLEACIAAGYQLLHIDTTVDLALDPGLPVSVDILVARTVELIAHAEACRLRLNKPPLAYEVGTEEVGGGLESPQRVEDFLNHLTAALARDGLPRPSFVVGDVGTTLDSGHFNVQRARRLSAVAGQAGALIKGHYTDDVANLEVYPICGIGGANVGPGLAAVEYAALIDLVRLERELGRDAGLPVALREAVVQSGRWKKWLYPEEQGLVFEDLRPSRQDWLVKTGSRYIWKQPAVEAARSRLYHHVAPYRNADAFVLWRIRQAVLRYYHAFNLINFNDILAEALRVER